MVNEFNENNEVRKVIDLASRERPLVRIQEVSGIVPIEGADKIELAKILGWQCVVLKGEFMPGDKAVYFEVDSFLPIDERYEFLRKSSYRKNDFMGEGFRIKTMRMRGQLSQGLLQQIKLFPEIDLNSDIDTDVTEALGVRKWYIPEVQTATGTMVGEKPYGIPTTDEDRLQSKPQYLDYLRGRAYIITTKMDGTSGTVFWNDSDFGCTSRNYKIEEDEESLYWFPNRKYGLRDKLNGLGKNIAIQGEICGPGIQKNHLRLKDYTWYVFDVYDLDTGMYYGHNELRQFCDEMGLTPVPVEEAGEAFGYSVEDLLNKAKGKYPTGLDKEGIVVRDNDTGNEPYSSGRRVSFKVLNNEALLKEKD